MQVILMERVVNLGNLGDVVKVKPGYARNFLIPHNKAKRVTPENMAEFEQRRAQLEAAQAAKVIEAQELAAKLEGMSVEITRKAGVDGRLFGSVTNFDIADGLAAQGVTLDRSTIRLPDGPLKQVGDAAIQVVLHTDVAATITVTVKGEL
jgi:large subunit ribosomal protein L9